MAGTESCAKKCCLNSVAGDEQLRRDMAIVHRMPLQFRVLARDLLRALIDDPAAMRIVGKILIEFTRASLNRQGDRAPKIH